MIGNAPLCRNHGICSLTKSVLFSDLYLGSTWIRISEWNWNYGVQSTLLSSIWCKCGRSVWNCNIFNFSKNDFIFSRESWECQFYNNLIFTVCPHIRSAIFYFKPIWKCVPSWSLLSKTWITMIKHFIFLLLGTIHGLINKLILWSCLDFSSCNSKFWSTCILNWTPTYHISWQDHLFSGAYVGHMIYLIFSLWCYRVLKYFSWTIWYPHMGLPLFFHCRLVVYHPSRVVIA